MDFIFLAIGLAAGLALEWFAGPVARLKKMFDGPSNPPPPPKNP